jgi:hypothetical protein
MENELKITQKRLELLIDKATTTIIKDLETINNTNFINKDNLENFANCYNHLAKADYHILKALAYAKGIDPQKYAADSTTVFFNTMLDLFKKTK